MQTAIAERPGLAYGGDEVLSWAAMSSGTWSPVAPGDDAAGAAPMLGRTDSSSSSSSGSSSNGVDAAASCHGGGSADGLGRVAEHVTRLSDPGGGVLAAMDPTATYGDEADDGDDMSGTSDACDSGVGSLDCGSSSCCAHGGGRDDVRRRSASVNEAKEQAYGKLKEELVRAQRELRLKDEECERLERVRCQIEAEVEELTASLFEEANKMVQEANIKRMHTEKLLSEANSKVDVLEAEVNALKTLVITSTPSSPNAHLHPQLSESSSSGSGLLGAGISIKTKLSRSESSRLRLTDLTSPVTPEADKKDDKKGSTSRKMHRRSASHYNVKVESPGSPVKEAVALAAAAATPHKEPRGEVDPSLFGEFVTWRRQPTTLASADSSFLSRALREDVEPCLGFASRSMSEAIVASVQENQLSIEPIAESKRAVQTCSLTDRPTVCSHRIRLAEGEQWYDICEHARNRIAAVCDFYTYVRYIKQGLVKSADEDSYWHVTQLRQRMCNARLGLTNSAV